MFSHSYLVQLSLYIALYICGPVVSVLTYIFYS